MPEALKILALILGYIIEIIIGLGIITLLTVAIMWGWEEIKETRWYQRIRRKKK